MSTGHPDTRRFPRVPAQNAVYVKRLDGNHPLEGFAVTRTVGLGGCMFLNDEAVGVGSALEVLISLEGRVVRAVSRVVYETPHEGDRYEVGVEFLEVSPEDREELGRILIHGP